MTGCRTRCRHQASWSIDKSVFTSVFKSLLKYDLNLLQAYEVHSGWRHAQTLSAGQSTGYMASPLEATASGDAGSKSVAVQRAAGKSTMQQVIPLIGKTGSAAN